MSQLPLFASTGDIVVADDQLGRITYTSDVVPPDVADAWFLEMRDAVPWKTQRRRMYDRDVDVPRLMASFRLPVEDNHAPDVVRAAAGKVAAVTGVPFNSVGLNFYRDGRDSVAPHTDLDDIVHGSPVALLSLGATRRMDIRTKEPPKRALHLDLAGGSLLVMSYDTQLHYTHAISKTRDAVGARISLAFRVKPPGG